MLDELLATSENGKHVYVGEKFSVGVRFFFSYFLFCSLEVSSADDKVLYRKTHALFPLS